MEFIRSEPKQSGASAYLECGGLRWVLDPGEARPFTKEAVESVCDAHGCSRWRLESLRDRFRLCETETAPHGRPPLLNTRTCWEFNAERTERGWRLTNLVVSARS